MFEIDGVGIPVFGPEEDYVILDNKTLGMNQLLKLAGVDGIKWQVVTGIETENGEDPCLTEYLEQYREKHGKKFPNVYRINILVSAEKLSDKESEQFWTTKKENYNE